MKRFLTSGLVMLAMAGATATFAQGKRIYDDDIYYNSKTAKPDKPVEDQPAQQYAGDEGNAYNSSGNSNESSNQRQYYDQDDYVNYEDEGYYSSHINRFYHPFYNAPYWSSYYDPYLSFSFSFGYAPYWSYYWGWPWYGNMGYSPYYYGGGYGGGYYGGYCGYYGGYSCGYYPSYYYPTTYGPRYSMNATRNSYAHGVGTTINRDARTTGSQAGQLSESRDTRVSGSRMVNDGTARQIPNGDFRNNSAENSTPTRSNESAIRNSEGAIRNNEGAIRSNEAPIRSNGEAVIRDQMRSFDNNRTPNAASPSNDRWNGGNELRSQSNSAEAIQPRSERRGWFSGRNEAPSRSFDRSSMDRSFAQPRMEQRSSPAPRMEAPSRSFGNSGARGFSGGGFSGGGGMRGGGGGGRR